MKKKVGVITIILLISSGFGIIIFIPSASSTTGWQWEALPPLQYPAVGYAEVYNSEIYHLGGGYVQVYSPANDTWWVKGLSSVSYRGGSAIIGDRIYFVQGWHDAKYYNISTNTFHDVTDSIVNRIDVSVTALNNILYVVGGWISGDPWTSITTVEAYSLTNDTWWEIAPLNIGRNSPAVVSYGGCIYVIGGKNYTDSPPYPIMKTVERYDPVTNNWSFVNSTNFPAHAATVTSEHIVLLSYESNIRRSEAYIPALDHWFMGPNPTWDWRSKNSAMVTLNSDAYVVGGRWANDTPLDIFYRWDGLESLAPNIQILTPNNNDFVDFNLNVSGTASDNFGLEKVEISLDQNNWVLCNGTETWYANVTLNAGLNTIYARATDTFNNTAINTVNIIVDIISPEIEIFSPVDGSNISSTNVIIVGSSNDEWGINKVEISTDNQSWVNCTGTDSWSYTIDLEVGVNRIYVRATDNAGNTNITSITVTVDIESPTINFMSPSEDELFSYPFIEVSGIASDNIGIKSVEISKGEINWTACNGTIAWSGNISLDPGLNMYYARATDFANNTNITNLTIGLDLVLPSISIMDPADGANLSSSNLTVYGLASDNFGISEVELSMDGVSWFVCNGTSSWQGNLTLDLGPNTIYARATDVVGHVTSTNIDVVYELPDSTDNNGIPPTDQKSWLADYWWIILIIVIVLDVIGVAYLIRRD